jgi:hypothetical protein
MLNRLLYACGALIGLMLLAVRVGRQASGETNLLTVAWRSFYQQDSGDVVLGGVVLLVLCWLSGLVVRQATLGGWFSPEEAILLDRPLQFWYGLAITMLIIFALTAIAYWLQSNWFTLG